MLNTILEESAQSFWSTLGKDLVKKAAATVVTEVVRSRIDLWKQMKLKRMRRELDVVWREEDRIYKERLAENKKEKEKEEELKPRPPTPEGHHNSVKPKDDLTKEQEDTVVDDTTPPEPEKDTRPGEDTDGTLDSSCYP